MAKLKSITILGCGESGSQWDGQGVSIGMNDAWKFGKPTTYLLCVQTIQQMQKYPDRLKTIINSKPERFFTHKKEWDRFFDKNVLDIIEIRRWKGNLNGKFQHSRTSPFIALTMAQIWGYDHIKLYGVDFNTHKVYSPGQSREFTDEMKNYRHLFKHLYDVGVKIECTKESYLNNFI